MKLVIKIIFVLFSLTIINVLTNQSSKHKNHISRKDGGGSWEQGYVIPRIRVWRRKEDNGEVTEVSNVRIQPLQIVQPDGEIQRSGMFFTFEQSNKIYGFLENILVPHPSIPDTYILPYKNIARKFFSKRVGMWKIGFIGGGRHTVIIGYAFDKNSVTHSYKDRFCIKITIPYEGNKLKDIREDQINRLIWKLNQQKADVNDYIMDLKKNVINISSAIARDKSILKDMENYGANHEALRKHYADRLNKLIKDISKPEIAMNIVANQIRELQSQLEENNKQYSLTLSNLQSKTTEHDEVLENLEKIESDKKISEEHMKEFEKKYVNSKNTFTSKLEQLSNLQPSAKEGINSIKNWFFEDNDKEALIRRLKRLS